MEQMDLTISCDECRLDGTSACEDCVVSFLLEDEPSSQPVRPVAPGVIVDAAEARAMRLLHSAGLIPTLRFERRVG